MKKRILIVCIHNSARSQMAEAYFNRLGGDIFCAESAGIEPGTLNPMVVEVLKEEGIDISGKETRSVQALHERGEEFDYVITVCSPEAAEACPVFPGTARRIHWPFADPSALQGSPEERLTGTRVIRDQIRETIRQFIAAERRSV